jgi:uncharacterized damage-inducible protein DinB
MITFLKDIAAYNHHTNEKLILAFKANDNKISDKSQLLFSHILNAHHIWNSRILAEVPLSMPWDEMSSKLFRDVNDANHKRTLKIINEVDLQKMIGYHNTKGESFSNSVFDILYHVFNHSNYHRAQIATDMKHSGLDPLVSDYIFYKREHVVPVAQL